MKTEKNILIAFILNLAFSVFEILGGIFTGSIAIISDSIHDFGDAISIGLSYFLEKKSKQKPDKYYTYGYLRYSVLGGFITSMILLAGSALVIVNSIIHIINPTPVNYDEMIIFAVFGVVANIIAAYVTRKGDSINQKAVNLHMKEDVLGWIVVLIGAIVMKFTDMSIIDPIMSLIVAIYITSNAMKNLEDIADLFFEKTPKWVSLQVLRSVILRDVDSVLDVHHIHAWSLDGYKAFVTMHVVLKEMPTDFVEIKEKIRGTMRKYGVNHVTIEFETADEECNERHCYGLLEDERPKNHIGCACHSHREKLKTKFIEEEEIVI